MQNISFTVDGLKLHGTLFQPKQLKEKNPALLFIHGWRSSEESSLGRAKKLAEEGFACLTYDMRGFGKSEGDFKTFSRRDYLNDALAAYDFLAKQNGVDKENISVIGASFGSYIAILLTKERNVANIALRVPANYPDSSFNEPQFRFSGYDVPKELYPRFKGIVTEKTFADRTLAEYEGNVLIIESEHDEIIPHETIESYLESIKDKSKLKYVVMKGVDHSMKDEKPREEHAQILVNWFKNKV